MTSPRRTSLAKVINRLLELTPCQSLAGVQAHLEILAEAVSADAFALLQIHPGKGTARIIGGSGLHQKFNCGQAEDEASHLAVQAANFHDGPALALAGPFPSDPFLGREDARALLIKPASDGRRSLLTTALRRDPKPFTPPETEKFAAVSGVINLAWLYCPLLWEEEVSRGTDRVTGLGLYSDFHQSMLKELSRARRSGGAVTMGIMSVVLPKADSMDDILTEVARTFQGLLRNFDTLDRYSSRELAFILPDLKDSEGVRVVNRVLGEAVTLLGGKGKAPDLYIGLSCYPEDGATVERLIEMAEAALNRSLEQSRPGVYRWKQGRDR